MQSVEIIESLGAACIFKNALELIRKKGYKEFTVDLFEYPYTFHFYYENIDPEKESVREFDVLYLITPEKYAVNFKDLLIQSGLKFNDKIPKKVFLIALKFSWKIMKYAQGSVSCGFARFKMRPRSRSRFFVELAMPKVKTRMDFEKTFKRFSGNLKSVHFVEEN